MPSFKQVKMFSSFKEERCMTGEMREEEATIRHTSVSLNFAMTKSGVLFGPNCQVYSPPMVLVEAMNLLFNKIKATVHESEGLLSLGTSDVVLVSTSNYHSEYHILFHLAMIALLTDKNKVYENLESLRYF
nr:hypothetical protein L203_04835 [Cryptococcus depauperatus CBS 7841]